MPSIMKGEKSMVYTDEYPGKGIYICKNCGASIKLETDTTRMPKCPRCNGTEFIVTK